jgi:hypothetical protein
MKDRYYLIVNKDGEAYAGMVQGFLTWTHSWAQGKPLMKENTSRILKSNPGTELLEL